MFFLAGVYAQPCDKVGTLARLYRRGEPDHAKVPVLSEERLCLIISNALCDWHGLYKRDPERFAFGAPGDLRWVPRRPKTSTLLPGTAAIVEPPTRPGESKLSYEVTVLDEWFIDLPLFVRSKALTKLGTIISGHSKQGYRWHFPPFVEFQIAAEHHLGLYENGHWRLLVETYAKASNETLTALASCRSPQLTTLSVIATVMDWTVWLRGFLDQTAGIARCYGDQLPDFDALLVPGQQAVKSLEAARDTWSDIERHVDVVKQLARSTELGKYVPIITSANIPIDCNDFLNRYYAVQVAPWIEGMMLLVNEIVQRLDGHKVNAFAIKRATTDLANIPNVDQKHLAYPKWADWLGDNASVNQAVQACYAVLSSFVHAFRSQTGFTINDVPTFYSELFDRYYPLPKMGRPPLKDLRDSGAQPEKHLHDEGRSHVPC